MIDDEQVIKSYTTQKTVLFQEVETELTRVTSQEELDELLREDRSFTESNQIGALFPLVHSVTMLLKKLKIMNLTKY
jgi:hypothetical protein